MRRKDREITDKQKIDEIIRGCHCCRLGFCDGDEVYPNGPIQHPHQIMR